MSSEEQMANEDPNIVYSGLVDASTIAIKDYMYSDIVTTKVGHQAQKIRIHKALLCTTSAYFKRCLTGSFKEAVANEVELLDVQPNAFEILVHYLYNPTFRTTVPITRPSSFYDMIHAWMLADRFMMPDAKDAIVDLIRFTVSISTTEGWNDRQMIFEGLMTIQSLTCPPGATTGLYRFFVERCA